MKIIATILLVLIFFCNNAFAQEIQDFHLSKKDFLKLIHSLSQFSPELGKKLIKIPVAKDKIYEIELFVSEVSPASIALRGRINNTINSNFFLDYDGVVFSGALIIENKSVYTFHSTSTDLVKVMPEDIDNVLCVENPYVSVPTTEQRLGDEAAESIQAILASNDLESLPGSPFVIFLDFDGHNVANTRWNNGRAFTAAPSQFSETKILETWELVAEDYKPFNINITTNESKFQSAGAGKRMRVIITPTTTASPNSGGVAYINSFTSRTREEPCFVFNLGNAKICGETISHEVGHTLGLKHDGRDTTEYFSGHNNWGPIMGAVYGSRMLGQFSKGEYNKASNTEDDLQIITSRNGFNYRTDDFGNDVTTASTLTVNDSGTINATNKGLIEKNTDKDCFKFTTTGGSVKIVVNPASRYGDLDISATLLNQQGTQILNSNNNGLATTINTTLSPGTYILSIEGTGAGNPSTDGYSKYGSLGSYYISGTIPGGNSVGIVTSLDANFIYPENNTIVPNPFINQFSYRENGDFDYIIYSAEGKMIESGKATQQLTTGEQLKSGFYMLHIKTFMGTKIFSIIKQ